MTREEILLKSQNEGKDEGMEVVENRGRKVGSMAFFLLEIVIIIFNYFTNQPNYVPLALFWAFTAAEFYPKYCFTHKKGFLISCILGAIASILLVVCHVITVLR